MGRRVTISSTEIKNTVSALKAVGLVPTALDTLPGGGMRWHFTQPRETDEDDLDRELREFEERNGAGRA